MSFPFSTKMKCNQFLKITIKLSINEKMVKWIDINRMSLGKVAMLINDNLLVDSSLISIFQTCNLEIPLGCLVTSPNIYMATPFFPLDHSLGTAKIIWITQNHAVFYHMTIAEFHFMKFSWIQSLYDCLNFANIPLCIFQLYFECFWALKVGWFYGLLPCIVVSH